MGKDIRRCKSFYPSDYQVTCLSSSAALERYGYAMIDRRGRCSRSMTGERRSSRSSPITQLDAEDGSGKRRSTLMTTHPTSDIRTISIPLVLRTIQYCNSWYEFTDVSLRRDFDKEAMGMVYQVNDRDLLFPSRVDAREAESCPI